MRWLRPLAALVVAFAASSAAVASCGGAPSGEPSPSVASPEERARARAQREARSVALEEQGVRPEKSKAAPAAPPPPPAPEIAEPEPEADAGPPDAGEVAEVADAAPVVIDAGKAPLDKDALCAALCDRAVACAREMFADAPADLGPDMMDPMLERIAEQCKEECQNEVDGEDRMKKGEACLEESDCDAFMQCVQGIMDEG